MSAFARSGFTLIEIMVVISIISILILGTVNINWNSISDAQRLTLSRNNLVSQIENIRNNALFGRAEIVGNIVPDIWRVDISPAGIEVFYQVGNSPFESYDAFELQPLEFLSQVHCGTTNIGSATGSLLITGNELQLGGSSDCIDETRLYFDLNYKGQSQTIEINAVNGLIGEL